MKKRDKKFLGITLGIIFLVVIFLVVYFYTLENSNQESYQFFQKAISELKLNFQS